MSKLVQRIVALVVMLAVVMSATAYGASTFVVEYKELKSDAPVVMTVNGEEIHADEYASYMTAAMYNVEREFAMYGISVENMKSVVADTAKKSAKQQVTIMHVIKQKMAELGLTPSYTQKKNIVQENKDASEQLGGKDNYQQYLAQIGFDTDNFNNYQYIITCEQVLNDYYFGENGVSVPNADEMQKYFEDNYITAKHIMIATVNPSTGETIRTDEEAKKEAQNLLDRLNNGEDFDALMTAESEDPGLKQSPNGYTFTEGDMVDAFYDGAKNLKEGEVSGLVKSQYGYHIIMRCVLDQSALETNRDAIIAGVAAENGTAGSLNELLQQWVDEATVETTDDYDTITYDNVKDYLPADVQAILNAESSDDQSATDSQSATDGQSDEQTTSDDQSATDEQTDTQSDSQTSTDEAQTATTESAQ